MIYFLYGTNIKKSRAKLHEMLDILAKKRPGSEIFKIIPENWSDGRFEELLGAQGLFDRKYIVVLDGVFADKNIKDCVMDKLSEMKSAEHPFILLEEKIDVASLKKIEKLSEKVQEFSKPEAKQNESGGVFRITGGLLTGDKKKLWVDYIRLLNENFSPEEIHGIIFWQLKNIILAKKAKNQKESGLSSYQYGNALMGAKNYELEKLLEMSSGLVSMLHKVRSGKGELEIMLEKWILEK